MRLMILLLGVLVAGSAVAEDGANGLWRTETSDEGGYLTVEIGACANNAERLCGVIKERFDGTGESIGGEIIGKQMIEKMKPTKSDSTSWHKGTIWAPDDDKTYKAKMSLADGGLKVSGCVFGGLICRSQVWMRVE